MAADNLSKFIRTQKDIANWESVNPSVINPAEIQSLQQILNRRGLAIACLNVNSLLAHIDQLRIFLSIHKIDIFTVNETKLDSSISSNEIHIFGYEVVRKTVVITVVMVVSAFLSKAILILT